MNFKVLITTSDAYVHLCRGFAYLWNKYVDWPVTIVWRNEPPPKLPDNFTDLHCPARWHDWSWSLIQALEQTKEEFILLGLEDFWVSGPAQRNTLVLLKGYMEQNPDVMRIDLTDDRKAYPHIMRTSSLYQAIVDPEQKQIQYLCSTQFSFWRRDFLLHALIPGELSPHFEVEGSRRVAPENPCILGAGFMPIPYHKDGVVWNGRLDNLHTEYLNPIDYLKLMAEGLL